MSPHNPEKQLEGLIGWFKGKAASGEPFGVEGAAHFLACMRELGRGIDAMRQMVDGFQQKCKEVEDLRLRLAILELREAENSGTATSPAFPSNPSSKCIPIQIGRSS